MNNSKSGTPCLPVLGAAALLTAFCSTATAQAPKIDWQLDEAIRQIQYQADNFDNAMARVETTQTTDDGETTSSIGTGFINDDGEMRYVVDGGQQITFVDRNTVEIYDAGAKTVDQYSLRSHPERLEPFIRLGFSITGRDLDNDYLVTIRGEEEVGDSRTIVMELTPTSNRTRETVRLVRLWIDQASWMPVRQEISATDGSTMTLNYTGMARNLRLKPELFDDDWPSGTRKNKK